MPSPAPSVYTKRVHIRWRDMDAFKHVNNSVYLTYLEEARDGWLLEVLGNGLLLNDFILARVAIDYRSPLVQDDGDVDVEMRCLRVGRASVTTSERIVVAGGGRLGAEAEAVLVHYDWETGRSRPMPDEVSSAFARWIPD
jgi:acyl-CoA thioester hydrolase